MIHYQTYTSIEAEKVVDLWNRSFGNSFPLDLQLWNQNVDQCPKSFPDATVVAVSDGHIVGAIVGKNPNHVSAIFVAPEFRRRGIATELLERAEVAFTGELETSLRVGQDDRHFFPGVPEDCLEARAFFEARGYKRSDGFACDLKRSLYNWKPMQVREDVSAKMAELNITLQPCTADLVPSLLIHIEDNFSARWLRDTRHRLEIESDPHETIVAIENDSDVVGFCHTYSVRSHYIGPSIYWRELLGEQFGGLGPIGVSKARRKIGLGLVLLSESISAVANTGATTMVIDWTNLIDFYARAGFSTWKKYISFSKSN
jgi:GNAT superfamily N-acetyltransferase